MGRVWDTSRYPSIKPFVALCQLCQIRVIQDHEAKHGKFKILGSSGVIHVLGEIFVNNTEK